MAYPLSFASLPTSETPSMPDSDNYVLQWSFCAAQVKAIAVTPDQAYFKTSMSDCIVKMALSILITVLILPIGYLLVFHLRGKTWNKGIKSVKTWILLLMLFIDFHLFS